ncbi:hypothetical protein [Puniceibacterium confluentis]|uniref:hypothetical protein n=1 Tax=Puniceibacterium confluentis TaxID=1958944 RepID=UPI0011B36B79|nr:hypothetical protein [Puniceibacterium confluentis]
MKKVVDQALGFRNVDDFGGGADVSDDGRRANSAHPQPKLVLIPSPISTRMKSMRISRSRKMAR